MSAQDMIDDIKFVHGFYLSVADGAGGPSDCFLPVFPERVVDVKPKTGGGSSITIRTETDEPSTFNVTQGADFVREAIRHCKELDKKA